MSLHPLSSVSRLGAGSRVVTVACSLIGLGFSLAATWRLEWPLFIPAGCFLIGALVCWLTRVRTTVTADEVAFFQLGRTIRVPYTQVHGCLAHVDRLGLGAGLIWSGPGQWGMLSGDDYLDLSYGAGRRLLVSHRDAQALAAEIMRHKAFG